MKKKSITDFLSSERRCKKLLLIMRLSIILILAAVFNTTASVYSQSVRVNLELKNATLEKVFQSIQEQTEFDFFYKNEHLPLNKIINKTYTNAKIDRVLDDVLKGTGLIYRVLNKDIIVTQGQESDSGRDDLFSQQQSRTISGKVTDENGGPLPGVTVFVKGTTQGTTTDVNGNYSIANSPNDAILIFSFVGMKSQEVVVGTQTSINITMAVDAIGIEEVVAVGYGTMKKRDVTGAVSSIKGKELTIQAVRNPVQSLSGLVPGVQVRQNSGAPGSNFSVIIRGGNSLLGGNEPLYVVDGFPVVGGTSNINPNDIESIEILKDASATAIYGSRGSNGVVLITTKSGKEGKTSVEYNGYYGIQRGDKFMNMQNAKEFAELANVRASNDGEAPYFSDSEIASFGKGTDWQDEIFQTAAIQNHTIAVSGGNNKTIFGVSGNYYSQDGIMINSDYKRYQLKTNFQHKISQNWKIFVDNILSRTLRNNLFSDNTSRGYGVLSAALTAPPTLTVYNENGDYTDLRQYGFSESTAENPVALANEQKDLGTRTSVLSNLSVEGQLLKNLILRSSLGLEYSNSRRDYYSSTKLIKSKSGDARISYGESTNIVNENTLSYSKVFNNHSLKLLGGITAQKTVYQSLSGSSVGFLTDILENYSLQSGSNSNPPRSGYSEYSILSYLGRLNYSYKGRYLITASMRADGSSRFGADNKWGYFPSVAGAWRITEEDFWGDNSVSNLKIRGSWGKTGNTAIAPYQSLSTLSSSQVVFNSNDINIGYAPRSIKPNSSLKWETTEQFDIGMDIGLFNEQLSFTFDYYHKNTYDLLASVVLPPNTGYMSMIDNVGSIQNKGFEASLNWRVIKGAFNWDIGANVSVNRNKVLSLSQGADIFGRTLGLPLSVRVNMVREGYPVGVFYGLKEDGITEEGLINYVDVDDNGEINNLDRQVIGDPNPNYIFGINSSMSFKNFGLVILIDGVQGNDVFNFNNSYIADGFSFGMNNLMDDFDNYWSVENPNPNAKYPKISQNTRYQASDRYVEDGSYVRIKNVQFSYTFGGERFEHSPLKDSQIYLGVQNLLTFTGYTGYSPLVNTMGSGISKGIDQTGYPLTRTIMLGARIKF